MSNKRFPGPGDIVSYNGLEYRVLPNYAEDSARSYVILDVTEPRTSTPIGWNYLQEMRKRCHDPLTLADYARYGVTKDTDGWYVYPSDIGFVRAGDFIIQEATVPDRG